MRRERVASPAPSPAVAHLTRLREQMPETSVKAGMPSRFRYMYAPLASAYAPIGSRATSGWHQGRPPASLSSTLLKKSWKQWLATTAHISQNLQLSRCASRDPPAAPPRPAALPAMSGVDSSPATARLDVRHGRTGALSVADTAA